METTHTTDRRAWRMVAAGLLGAAALAGCGSGGSYRNDLRPPAPINLTASISSRGIAISPPSIGAGPIVLIVTNQTASSQAVTLETDTLGASTGGLKQTTEPINPRGTGELKVDVAEGRYRVSVGDSGIPPATITVGPKRQSAQNQVLQP
jgi:hypothetical protein